MSLLERMKRRPRREWLTLAIGALIYALLFSLGSQTDQQLSISPGRTAMRFALALPVSWAALEGLFHCVLPRLTLAPDAPGKHKKPFCTLGAFAFLFLCYVPLFLIFYPGSFTYDSMKQVHQVASGQYDPILPLLHTLFIGFCLSFYDVFQSVEACGALCSVLQMLIVSACFALVAASISRSVSRRAARMTTLFFGLYPAHMAFASNCTKDVMFSSFLALFLALCFEEIGSERWPRDRRAMQIACGVLACLLRNNMIYAMIAWVFVLLLRRKAFARLLVSGALVVALSLGINAGLNAATHASGGRVTELLSVPLQQLARARLHDAQRMSEEEKAFTDALLVNQETGELAWKNYDPTLADPVKSFLDDDAVRAQLPELFSVWLSVGRKCPAAYMDAFMELALPSLYPYSEYRVTHRYIEVHMGTALTAPFGMAPIVQPRRFEGARNWLNAHLFMTGADEHPVLRWLFNIGLITWTLMLFVLCEAYSGQSARLTLLLLPVLLWLPYLLGPVMQARYLYPFICALPLFVLRPAHSMKTEPAE